MTDFRAPKGTEDILPPDSSWWRKAHGTFEDLCERYGYGLTLTPLFEDTAVFARGVGGDTEVVEKQMYSFEDKGGRSITLRPEATASVVRAQIQAGGVPTRFKGSYWGPMFRYERPQKGRNRQFTQGGVEYLGSESPEADVEVIEFGWRYLNELGMDSVQLRLNTIGDASDRAAHREELRVFLDARRDRLSEDAQRRIDTNPLRVLDSKVDGEVVADAPIPSDFLSEEATQHFAAVQEGLRDLGIPFELDGKLVRGLDYYNRTVWEYVPVGYQAAQSSVGGGGRYDGLFEVLGGRPTPGVGLAMGIDRIWLAMDRPVGPAGLDVFVVVADDDQRATARILTTRLRHGGFRTDMTDRSRSMKAQFKDADRSDSAYAIVVGAEWAEGEVTIKDLASGDQHRVATKEIEEWLRAR